MEKHPRQPDIRPEGTAPMPEALGAALMEADATLGKFSRLTEEEKRAFIGGAENLHTGYELRSYVRSFFRGEALL
ncbi:MAG: hypothetical protein II889_02130 [Clostridia bacterium]|nr:hypothetical protein [Clostridia bacterium]MCR4905567.1 hypothetical protein [Clostridiales bacterium]